MSMISSWFLSCNIMYKDIMLGVGRIGGKDEYCLVTYVMIIVDFLLTPEMQMLPKYHQLSCVNMKKKKICFCFVTKEWYTDICQILLMRSLFLCVNYRIFPFCSGLLSMYFGMMYDDCCSVTSDLTSPIQFWLTNGWLLVEMSTPKNV